tara:strand:- start:6630 stop:7181 length:552 start_codon:yes stop_codon:yes gene_type:complete
MNVNRTMHTEEQIKTFFFRHQHLFSKPKNARIPHADIHAEMMKNDPDIPWTWGKCFPMAGFMFHYYDGYNGDWDLKCIRQIPYTLGGIDAITSHWFTENKVDGRIIDLSVDQFEGILDIVSLYPTGRRSNIGFPHHYVDGKKIKVFGTAPSKQVLGFYRIFRVELGIVPTLEYHLNILDGKPL